MTTSTMTRGQWPVSVVNIVAIGLFFTLATEVRANYQHQQHRQNAFAAAISSSPSVSSFNDLAFFGSPSSLSAVDSSLDRYFESSSAQQNYNNDSCAEIWCESTDPNYYDEDEFYDDDDENGGFRGTKGFWLEPPPDDILFMPPPPMPPAFQASLLSNLENDSLKDYIISEDPVDGIRCNFCKKFADPTMYPPIDTVGLDHEYPINSAASKDSETFVSSFYLLIFTIAVLGFLALLLLIKYKKWKIFPVSESCPILTSGVLGGGHHKSSSGSSGSPSDTRLPVVNEKSPQSIIMDAPLASLGKKSTISTTGKYWKRIPNNVSGNIFSMEDRRGLRSLGGSSTGMSDHPYSDAASCTSSPVYAELDPSVAGSCHTPTLIGPPGTGAGSVVSSFSPYAFSNTYSEVPDSLRGHLVGGHGMSPSLLTDSSTYDNAAYLSASAQPFLPGHNHYNTRSLRRLAAQRSAAMNVSTGQGGQVSTPLLAGHHPYHGQPYHHTGTMHHLQSTPIGGSGQFQFLTGGRPLKKPRSGNHQQQQTTGFGYRTGPRSHHQAAMNHYVTQGSDSGMDPMMLSDDQQHLTSPPPSFGHHHGFSSFMDNASSNGSNRKSSSSSQYTEMPLLNNTTSSSAGFNNGGGQHGGYRMAETCSANDLNSAASSSSGGSAGGNGVTTNSTSSAHSSTSLKRPLPPVPGSLAGHVRL